MPKSLGEIHRYWSSNRNSPKSYLKGEARSKFLLGIIDTPKNSKILEIGCSVGRNLNYLFKNGFTNLVGVEINKKAVGIAKINPKLKIYNSSIEDIIKTFKGDEFDVVFTMAVLEHIHTISGWIFPEIARITKKLITIEDEKSSSWRHFPRNYKSVFEPKLKQIKEINLGNIEGLGEKFVARIFIKI